MHIYFSYGQKLPIEALNYSIAKSLLKWSSMILRLCDDLGTSTVSILHLSSLQKLGNSLLKCMRISCPPRCMPIPELYGWEALILPLAVEPNIL